jgi:hypothetical protein
MKQEKSLFAISISETIILSLFFLVVLNGVIFLFSVIFGKPSLFFNDYGWISQIVFPIVYSIIQSSINRNGVLMLTDFSDVALIAKQLETIIFKRGYMISDRETENVKYGRTTKWGRFFNLFFREDITIRVTENGVSIFAKRNMLNSIELKLIYGKANG